jgi:5-keto-L-gluconate epimerase
MKLAYPVATPEVRAPVLGLKGAPAEMFAHLRDAGYDGIEPFVANPRAFDNDAWARAVEQSGLSVIAVGTGPLVFDDQLSFTAADESARRAAIDRAKDAVRFAARWGAQLNIGKLRGEIAPEKPQAWSWLRDAVADVCAEADSHGIAVTLEPQCRGIINTLNTTQSALVFLAEMALPNLRLMLDTYHMDAEGEDLGAEIRRVAAAGALLHVHFADTDRRVPGDGRIDFPAVLAALRGVAYDRAITIEIKQDPDPLSAARRAAVRTREFLSRA